MKQNSTGSKYWMHHDALGSVKVITNSNGDSVATYKYYPFGDSLFTRGSAKNDMQFTGKPNIAGIEAYDFNARYYDPEIGRFYSIDPLWNPAESPYAYCNNNPVNITDPTGMDCIPGQKPVLLYVNGVLVDAEARGLVEMEGCVVSGGDNKAFELAWAVYELLHSLPMIDPAQGRFSGYLVQHRLIQEIVNAGKGNGGGNTNTVPTPPPGRPGSELGAVTGGMGNNSGGGGNVQPTTRDGDVIVSSPAFLTARWQYERKVTAYDLAALGCGALSFFPSGKIPGIVGDAYFSGMSTKTTIEAYNNGVASSAERKWSAGATSYGIAGGIPNPYVGLGINIAVVWNDFWPYIPGPLKK
jgi:RHS repeat-associated protein